jgi:hypothetical protein
MTEEKIKVLLMTNDELIKYLKTITRPQCISLIEELLITITLPALQSTCVDQSTFKHLQTSSLIIEHTQLPLLSISHINPIQLKYVALIPRTSQYFNNYLWYARILLHESIQFTGTCESVGFLEDTLKTFMEQSVVDTDTIHQSTCCTIQFELGKYYFVINQHQKVLIR